jgi:hypothetical protein
MDVYYFQDWKKRKEEGGRITDKDVETRDLVDTITKQAKSEKKAIKKKPKKAEMNQELKKRRRTELGFIGEGDTSAYLEENDTVTVPREEIDTSDTNEPFNTNQYKRQRFKHSLSILRRQQKDE